MPDAIATEPREARDPDRSSGAAVPLARAHDVYKVLHQGTASTAIIRGLSIDAHAAEFACIMGPSGSGKSTLLHVLSGLDRPTAGDVELGGVSLTGLSERERTAARRRTVGYVFQFFNLLPNLSVFENVGLPIAIQGGRPERERDRIESLLERLGIAERKDALPHQLSGGEMQRASIARALAGDQPLLLCDEPTGNLSQKAGREVMEILRELCDEDGRGVLLVTHNPRDATFADRVHFLVDGELAPELCLHGPNLSVEAVHEALSQLSI